MTTFAPSTFPLETRTRPLSQDQFANLVAEHQSAVCAVAYSALRDRAASEEIAQEAFLLAWRKLPELSEPPKMPAWICGIARNLAKNARRQAGRVEPSAELEEVASAAEGPLDELLGKETEALVARALASLSESYREPLVLFYRQDQSVRQVAEALEISEATAKQRLSRGREKLNEAVRDLVERSLRRTGPGAAFTAAVVASIASLPQPVKAQPVARAARPAFFKAAIVGGAIAAVVAAGAVWVGAGKAPDEPPGAGSSAAALAAAAPAASTSSKRAAAERANAEGGPHYRPRPGVTRGGSPSAVEDDEGLPPALSAALDRKVDLVLNQAAPREVLKLLGQIAETPIVVVGDLPSDVSVNIHAVTLRQALDETLEHAGGVWEDVELVRVVDSPGPSGPMLEGPELDITVQEADFSDVLELLGQSLEMPVQIESKLEPAPVTLRVQKRRAGALLAEIVRGAGLRYEVVPAIEVRPED
jgi:RNA polymerase sigma factor (sigma-70 family)